LSNVLPKMYQVSASFYVPVVQDVFSLTTETGGTVRAVPAPSVVRDQLRGYFGILTSRRVAARVSELLPERTISQVRRGTRFQLTNAGMFIITATDRDPVIAARMANGYADSFNDLFEEISLPRAAKIRRFIEKQLDKVRGELAKAEQDLKEFKRKHKAVSLAEETSHLLERVIDFRARADLARVSLNEIRVRIGVVEKRLEVEAQMQLSSTVVAMNPLIQRLQGKLSDLEVNLGGLRAKLTTLHPEVIKVQQEILETRKRVRDEMERIVASETHSLNPVYENLRQDLVTLYSDERAISAKLAGLQGITRRLRDELQQLPELQRLLSGLTRKVRHLEETDRMLALKLEDARIQEKREIQTFLVVDRAVPSKSPAYPNVLASVPAAGALGGVAGLFYAMFLGYLRART
ncbi:MAG: GumC family protein, partial [Acidobacteriota bacterium]